MANMTLDQDKQCFAEWRSQRHQRQPIPDELWRVACNHISILGITPVAREFRLKDNKLRENAGKAGIVLYRRGKRDVARPKKVAFQEISLDRMFAVDNFRENKIRYYALSGPNRNSVARYLSQILGYPAPVAAISSSRPIASWALPNRRSRAEASWGDQWSASSLRRSRSVGTPCCFKRARPRSAGQS